jgi:hypothetical protein
MKNNIAGGYAWCQLKEWEGKRGGVTEGGAI